MAPCKQILAYERKNAYVRINKFVRSACDSTPKTNANVYMIGLKHYKQNLKRVRCKEQTGEIRLLCFFLHFFLYALWFTQGYSHYSIFGGNLKPILSNLPP
jgi:hypothetical protein